MIKLLRFFLLIYWHINVFCCDKACPLGPKQVEVWIRGVLSKNLWLLLQLSKSTNSNLVHNLGLVRSLSNKTLSCHRETARRFLSYEHFPKSLKIIQRHSKRHWWVGRKSLLLFHWNYVCIVPFLRYSASKNGVTWKPRVGVVQDHWEWRRSIDHIWLSIGPLSRLVR